MLLPQPGPGPEGRPPSPPSGGDRGGPKPLGERIRQRIARRLNDRVRDLEVIVRGNSVVLRGHCATYYSKQLAQHAALGAIEDESLENDIQVQIAR